MRGLSMENGTFVLLGVLFTHNSLTSGSANVFNGLQDLFKLFQ